MYMYLYFKKYYSYIIINFLILLILFDEIKIKFSFIYFIVFIGVYWLIFVFIVYYIYVLVYVLYNGYIIVNVKIFRYNLF